MALEVRLRDGARLTKDIDLGLRDTLDDSENSGSGSSKRLGRDDDGDGSSSPSDRPKQLMRGRRRPRDLARRRSQPARRPAVRRLVSGRHLAARPRARRDGYSCHCRTRSPSPGVGTVQHRDRRRPSPRCREIPRDAEGLRRAREHAGPRPRRPHASARPRLCTAARLSVAVIASLGGARRDRPRPASPSCPPVA